MFFEAELKGKKYNIKVSEERSSWSVSLQEDGQDWTHYTVDKKHYQKVEGVILFLFKGSSYLMDVTTEGTKLNVYTRGSYRSVEIFNDEQLLHESLKHGSAIGGEANLRAGMPGKIIQILVAEGDEVKKGQPLLIMEAMKMENEMRASQDCAIDEIFVKEGQSVESGAHLLSFRN